MKQIFLRSRIGYYVVLAKVKVIAKVIFGCINNVIHDVNLPYATIIAPFFVFVNTRFNNLPRKNGELFETFFILRKVRQRIISDSIRRSL